MQESLDLKKKILILTVLALISAACLYSQFSLVMGQTSSTSITTITPASSKAGAPFSMDVQGVIQTSNGPYRLLFNGALVYNGTSVGNVVNATFTVAKLNPGNYNVTLQDVASNTEFSTSYKVVAEGIAAIPTATVLIMGVALAISFANLVLNRVLITRMIGWHEYRAMQKELSEYNSQRMAALRSKDEKVLEKLKKKESQIQAMQTKMFKPQLLLLPMTAIYFVIWPILEGFFPFPVAYLPGFGTIPFFYWYLIVSFFFGTVASRIIGVTPIQ